jgi:hypothetical protein
MRIALAYAFAVVFAWAAIFRMIPEAVLMVRALLPGASP